MSETNVNKKWYVVRAVSGQENKIKAYIENEISRLGLNDYVEQVLVPTEKVIQIRKGKKIQKEKMEELRKERGGKGHHGGGGKRIIIQN